MALTPDSAIAAGLLGQQVVALQAFVTQMTNALNAGAAISNINLNGFNFAASYNAGALTAAQSAVVLNQLIPDANALITQITAQLATM